MGLFVNPYPQISFVKILNSYACIVPFHSLLDGQLTLNPFGLHFDVKLFALPLFRLLPRPSGAERYLPTLAHVEDVERATAKADFLIQLGQIFPSEPDAPVINLAFIADRARDAGAHVFAVPVGGVVDYIVLQHCGVLLLFS